MSMLRTHDTKAAVAAMLSGHVPLRAEDRALLADVLRGHSTPKPAQRAALRDLMARAQFRLALMEARHA